MSISVGLSVLIGLWFLIWGITEFTGRVRPISVFLGIVAIIIGILELAGRFVVSAG